MENHEELSIAEIEGSLDKYALSHQTYGEVMSPGKVLANISWDRLIGYVEGANLGKNKKSFFMYNGISSVARNGFFPDLKFFPLEDKDLTKFLEQAGLDRKFSLKEIRSI